MSNRIVSRESPTLAALTELAQQNGGILNPLLVVEAARNPDSVLHDHFEWADDKAADGFRLIQAGMLIRRVKLKIVTSDAEQRVVNIKLTRAFESLPSLRRRDGGYLPVQVIAENPDQRQELLDRVLVELEALKNKYRDISDLDEVWESIDFVVRGRAMDVVGADVSAG